MAFRIRWKTVGIHLAGCFSFLLLPILFNPRPSDINILLHNFRTLVEAVTYLLLLGFFYVNYYWFIPQYYFNGKRLVFFVLVISCFCIIAFLPDLLFDRPSDNLMPPLPGPRGRHIAGLFQFGQTLFLFLVVVFFSLMLKTAMRLRQAEKEKMSAEISYLKAQINPHFLFNTLNGIYSMALNQSPATANAVVKLSNLMRYVITDASVDFISLDKEIDYLKNFIELQQIRFGLGLKIELKIEGDTYTKMIAPLIIMPLVENAFKYGINPEEESTIKIQITVDSTSTTFNIVNNKLNVKNIEQTGIGLRNVRKRLELIYPGKHELVIRDDEQIFDITLKLR